MENIVNDAWETWKTYFQKTINPKINKKVFYDLFKLNKPTKLRLKSIKESIKESKQKSNKIENINYKRLEAKTAKSAYPSSDRPRGERDILSVEWHIEQLKKNNPVLPIIIIKTLDQNNKRRTILLDGMHRLVASAIASQKTVSAIVLDYIAKQKIMTKKGGFANLYAITFSDIDAPSKQNPINADWLHYLEINHSELPKNLSLESIALNTTAIKDRVIMPYEAPNPPKGSGPHRYILRTWLQPKYHSDIVHINERSKFNTLEFANKNAWKLINEKTIVVENK